MTPGECRNDTLGQKRDFPIHHNSIFINYLTEDAQHFRRVHTKFLVQSGFCHTSTKPGSNFSCQHVHARRFIRCGTAITRDLIPTDVIRRKTHRPPLTHTDSLISTGRSGECLTHLELTHGNNSNKSGNVRVR